MNFKKYVIWLLQCIVQDHRPCDTCQGSDGYCDCCNDWHNLYKKDCLRFHKKIFRI